MPGTSAEQLNNKQHGAVIEYYDAVIRTQSEVRNTLRGTMVNLDKLYQRETDELIEQRRAKAANRGGDSSRYQNIVVPVVKPQVETATAYQTSVFLSGVPLFGVVANPDFIDEALQLETVVDEQARLGGWKRELMMSFRDGYKYNYAPMEVSWEQQVSYVIETDIAANATQGIPKEVVWSGNKVKRFDPYNTIIDPTVAPSELYLKGEFGGHTELMGRMQLKQFIAALPNKQTRVTEAFETGSTRPIVSSDMENADYYIPTINSDQELQRLGPEGINWMQWASLSGAQTPIDYKNAYHVTTLYARILPSEFTLKVPSANTPQVWKFIIINHSTVIYSERQTNAHNWLPILVGQPSEDGLDYQTKSLASDAEPFQQVASANMNSITASRRRSVTDRLLYDPSRVNQAQINNPNPSAKIPVKPAAYGKDISDAVYQFPYREDQNAMGMAQIQDLLGMADMLNGQNPTRRGQFVKGNKTREEFSEITDNSVSRDVMSSILYEDQVFMPMKHIIKTNILQFQGPETLQSQEKGRSVSVDPVAMRKAVLQFRMSDGLVPSSKIISGENFAVALQAIGSSPSLTTGYNVAPMFSYLMKTKGADLSPFEKSPEQMAYEQAVSAWQQMVALAIEKSETGTLPENFPPQPLPEQFGYNPNPDNPQQQASPLDAAGQ